MDCSGRIMVLNPLKPFEKNVTKKIIDEEKATIWAHFAYLNFYACTVHLDVIILLGHEPAMAPRHINVYGRLSAFAPLVFSRKQALTSEMFTNKSSVFA